MISIIVPVYNVEKYLKKCVESILCQTYKDWELLLVDDGSPDESGKLCDAFAEQDPRITVIHQKNTGLAGARNAGLAAARGEFIAFVDSDDSIAPYTMELLSSMMTAAPCDLAICGSRIVWEGENFSPVSIKQDITFLDTQGLWEEVFGRLNNAVWNKLYRRELLGELRFPQGLIHGEDLIFNLQYLAKCKTGAINQSVCYNYLQRENSITSSSFSPKKLMEIEAKDQALALVEQYCPAQIKNGEKYCFRARMNVIRGICSAGECESYPQELRSCQDYIKSHYLSVKDSIRTKEKMEYWLCTRAFNFYKELVKGIW